ncbi:tRNA(Ile)-lysidine synthetase [hydrothermal vent metagenome]|uniref:tRNA(Ile)-lysidine synthetase n=1 Tax=hydrothermal vent metagenome TaxID=652676 RepID=A0A3B1B672_9ZZZZ
MALLHAMAELQAQYTPKLVAIHVNHGLQVAADDWAKHCKTTCHDLDVALIEINLNLEINKGESIEAMARNARYQAIKEQMTAGDMLLTAHHQDDQAETLLLQLMRGSGPSGLAAMPQSTEFGPGFHGRPLLGFSRKQLQAYASAEGLVWVEDSSNQDRRFDRNFLRQEIVPLLQQRWPAMSRTISRSASHCAEAQALIDEMAGADLDTVQSEDGTTLSVNGLIALPAPRCRAVLRAWVKMRGYKVPDAVRLEQIQTEVLAAAPDRKPVVHWSGVEVRRYRDRLFLMTPLLSHDPSEVLAWDGQSPLLLPAGLGVLTTSLGVSGIALDQWSAGDIEVRFRTGGERCLLIGRNHSHSLKKLLQEQGIPPWQRDRIPLIYIHGQLAAVGDLWVCKPFLVEEGEQGISLLLAD